MRSTVTLGLIVAPRLERDVPAEFAGQFAEDLARRHPSVDWRTELVLDQLVEPPARLTDILEDARLRLLRSRWHLAVVVTDLPLRNNGKPVFWRASRTHGVGVLSLPALGPLHVRPRLRRGLVDLIDELLGRVDREAGDVLRELTSRNAERIVILRPLFVIAVLFSHLRLLLGMVRANRPWRLVGRLYAALIAALAVGAYGVVTFDIWRLSVALGWWRLTITSAVSIAVTIATVIIVPGLWERTSDPRVRGQVVLFNLATATTVAARHRLAVRRPLPADPRLCGPGDSAADVCAGRRARRGLRRLRDTSLVRRLACDDRGRARLGSRVGGRRSRRRLHVVQGRGERRRGARQQELTRVRPPLSRR